MRRWAIRFLSRAHLAAYRLSSGRVLGSVAGMPVLLLTTTGRRSGKARTTPHVMSLGWVQRPFHAGSLKVSGHYGLQCRHVFDDRAASRQRAGRPVFPICIGAEHEERVPDELTGRAVGVAEGVAHLLLVVPVVGRAPVDEQVGDVEAGVERHHGEPDDVDAKVAVRVSLEDLRLHRTGAALADASGRRQQQE